MNKLLMMYVIFGLLQVALALPLLYGKVKPNPWYGLRVPSTLKDSRLWYPANQYIARWLLGSGILFTAASVILYLVPGMTMDAYAIACSLVFLVSITATLIAGFRYLSRLKELINKSRD